MVTVLLIPGKGYYQNWFHHHDLVTLIEYRFSDYINVTVYLMTLTLFQLWNLTWTSASLLVLNTNKGHCVKLVLELAL